MRIFGKAIIEYLQSNEKDGELHSYQTKEMKNDPTKIIDLRHFKSVKTNDKDTG